MNKKAKYMIGTASIVLAFIMVAVFALIFWWYARTIIPRTYPTVYGNFFFGIIHGLFIVPTLIWSLFSNTVTIYQSPNATHWYNIGYFIGISMVLGGSHGARSTRRKRLNHKHMNI